MVETKAIRRAKDLLKRNRIQFEFGDRTEDFFYYSNTYHCIAKNLWASEGPASYVKRENLISLKVILNSV